MATATKRRTYRLREDARGSSVSVDRDGGVIRGVKIISLSSRNSTNGSSGRRYLPEALQSAVPMYEGAAVTIDHPKRPNEVRDSADVFGRLVRVRFKPGDGLYGDLEFLKSHPMAAQICEAAERMPELFALSHNADGEGDVQDGVFVVREITEVRSVDVVTRPGSTTSLFESEARPMKLREAFEALNLKDKSKSRLVKLLEEDMPADVLDAPMDMPAEATADWKADLVAAIGKLVASEDAADHDMAKKVMAMLKPASAAAVPEEGDMKDKKDDDEETVTEERDAKGHGWEEENDDERHAAFGRMRKAGKVIESLEAENARLKAELAVHTLCESLNVKPSPALRTALLALPGEKERKALLEDFRGTARRPVTQRPGTQAEPTALDKLSDPKDIAEFLTGRRIFAETK